MSNTLRTSATRLGLVVALSLVGACGHSDTGPKIDPRCTTCPQRCAPHDKACADGNERECYQAEYCKCSCRKDMGGCGEYEGVLLKCMVLYDTKMSDYDAKMAKKDEPEEVDEKKDGPPEGFSLDPNVKRKKKR